MFDESLLDTEKADLQAQLQVLSDEELVEILNDISISKKSEENHKDVTISGHLQAIYANILLDERLIQRKINSKSNTKVVFLKIISVAALLLFVLGVIFQNKLFVTDKNNVDLLDISPAIAKATVVLSNGDQVIIDSMSSGLIYNRDGLKVFVNQDGELQYEDLNESQNINFLEIKTPKGGFTKVKLSDSTVVEMSSASTLRYPVEFSDNKREVYLDGEAHFDVSKDKLRPFFVHSNKQSIEVLGTKFNLKTTQNINKTILFEGSVKIISDGKGYLLKPGQQAVVGESVDISYIEPTVIKKWDVGKFVFDNSSFVEILKEIENWYNVKMVFSVTEMEKVNLSGTVSKSVKLSEILKVIEMNTNYKFTIEERRVIVKHL